MPELIIVFSALISQIQYSNMMTKPNMMMFKCKERERSHLCDCAVAQYWDIELEHSYLGICKQTRWKCHLELGFFKVINKH